MVAHESFAKRMAPVLQADLLPLQTLFHAGPALPAIIMLVQGSKINLWKGLSYTVRTVFNQQKSLLYSWRNIVYLCAADLNYQHK